MVGFLVSIGKALRDTPSYPIVRNTFCVYTHAGEHTVARFDDSGNVFDLKDNFLGNPYVEDEDDDEVLTQYSKGRAANIVFAS